MLTTNRIRVTPKVVWNHQLYQNRDMLRDECFNVKGTASSLGHTRALQREPNNNFLPVLPWETQHPCYEHSIPLSHISWESTHLTSSFEFLWWDPVFKHSEDRGSLRKGRVGKERFSLFCLSFRPAAMLLLLGMVFACLSKRHWWSVTCLFLCSSKTCTRCSCFRAFRFRWRVFLSSQTSSWRITRMKIAQNKPAATELKQTKNPLSPEFSVVCGSATSNGAYFTDGLATTVLGP